jgi:hypothetical protein
MVGGKLPAQLREHASWAPSILAGVALTMVLVALAVRAYGST